MATTPEPSTEQEEIDKRALRSARAITRTRRKRALARFWMQFRRNRMGKIGLFVIIGFVTVAVAAPLLASRDQLSPAYAAEHNQPPLLKPSWLLTQADREELTAEINPGISEEGRTDYFAITTFQYPLGTDREGRSVWALAIFGARISLLIALVATIMTMVIGAGIGITAGFFGGRVDLVLSRIIEAFLILPWIALAVVLAAILGQSLFNIMLIIAITSWATTSQLVRAQALTVKTRGYVERARALGASNWHVVTRHILPNLFPIIFANLVLTISVSVLAEALLSFLGLGDPNSVSWGTMLEGAQTSGATKIGAWWYVLTPGLCITILVLALTMCGFAIEEIINPRLRKR